jgi:hypothetical protein
MRVWLLILLLGSCEMRCELSNVKPINDPGEVYPPMPPPSVTL